MSVINRIDMPPHASPDSSNDSLLRPSVAVPPAGVAYDEWVAGRIIERLQSVLAQQDRCSLMLTGGNTPRSVYTRLSHEPFAQRLDWSRVDFFWGDERAVPPDHPDSNYKMAWETLLHPLGIPSERIHRMHGEAASLDQAAGEYELLIRDHVIARLDGVPALDLVLLGMGEDGHTASLFPNTLALMETGKLVVANDVPQLQARRLTVTFPLLQAAHAVWFLVTGANKARRLTEILVPSAPIRYPCQRVSVRFGSVQWLLDGAAADLLPLPIVPPRSSWHADGGKTE